MRCTEILKARVSPEIKLLAKVIANRELLTEAAWLKQLVMKEIRAIEVNGGGIHRGHAGTGVCRPLRDLRGRFKAVYVRFSDEDRLLLESRAAARGMRPATYVSVLTRAHLRALTPLPKDELLALKRSIGELASIGRNINQMAKLANEGDRLPSSVRAEFRAMLKICEALRASTKALIKANIASWSTGHVEADI